jgi:hypothetical protein
MHRRLRLSRLARAADGSRHAKNSMRPADPIVPRVHALMSGWTLMPTGEGGLRDHIGHSHGAATCGLSGARGRRTAKSRATNADDRVADFVVAKRVWVAPATGWHSTKGAVQAHLREGALENV